MNTVKLILGTMSFGEQIFGSDATEIVQYFIKQGYCEFDTAYVYNSGKSEMLLGSAHASLKNSNIKIATKVNPRVTGHLDKKAVYAQFAESIKRMGIEKVDTLYLHFPDQNTPIEEALEACADLYSQGKFERLGLSNFPSWLVLDVYNKCKENGWMLPKVYEGLYNPLSRNAEGELDKVLDNCEMSFYAYNPLAGGMLTNKYTGITDEEIKGRFTYRPNYRNRYWKESYFKAMELVKSKCESENINIVEATYRWMAYHSMLKASRGDGIIIGVSRLSQLKQNIETINKGELPGGIVEAFASAWKICKNDAPEYFRFYK